MHYDLTTQKGQKRKERSRNLLPTERVEIGVEAHFDTAKRVAERWGLGVGTVYGIKNGFVQTSGTEIGEKDTALVEEIEKSVEKTGQEITGRAGRILLDAMNNITGEKLAAAKLRELSGVARDMAGVIERVNGKNQSAATAAGVQFNIYAPRIMHEKDLGPSIDVIPERR